MALTLKKPTLKKPTLPARFGGKPDGDAERPPVSAQAAPARDVVESGPDGAPSALDRGLVVASSILLPLGLVSIVLAWYGASHTPYLFEQIPYLISGGLLGLALVVGAGVCYIGSWVTRSSRDQRAAHADLVALLAEIRDGLADAATASALTSAAALPAQTSSRRRRPEANGHDEPGRLVATASGSMLHRPDCAVVVSRPDVREVSESTPGLAPCRLCDPLASAHL